jgi:transcriptional regulator with XRE-family HTH domain
MSQHRNKGVLDDELLNRLKEVSGRRIEDERRRQRLTQRQLAERTGISTRWLREIESGNPIVKLDDHLRCGAALQLVPTYIFLPLIGSSYGRPLPNSISVADLGRLGECASDLASTQTQRPVDLLFIDQENRPHIFAPASLGT